MIEHNTTIPESIEDTHILEDAAQTVYNRPKEHGKPEDSFGRIAELWNGYLRTDEFFEPNICGKDVANMMVLLKVARNAEGHYHEDNYVDIAGYSECGARLQNDE
jgi:hypothetical protein